MVSRLEKAGKLFGRSSALGLIVEIMDDSRNLAPSVCWVAETKAVANLRGSESALAVQVFLFWVRSLMDTVTLSRMRMFPDG